MKEEGLVCVDSLSCVGCPCKCVCKHEAPKLYLLPIMAFREASRRWPRTDSDLDSLCAKVMREFSR